LKARAAVEYLRPVLAAAVHIPHDAPDADTPDSSMLGHAFLQERVAVYALCGFLMGVIFFVFRAVSSVTTGRLSWSHPSFIYHAAGMSVFLVVWLLARRGRYSLRTIRLLDDAATFLCAILYGVMSIHLPIGFRPDYVLIISLTYILVTRSTLVPSTSLRTAVLAATVGAILLVTCYFASAGADLSVFPAYLQRELAPRTCLIRSGAWWLLTTTLAMMTSHVVYGLQREIHRVRRLGQYALEEKLGEGGMGVVYRASHATLRRPTAVKLLAPEKAGAVTIARFEREVRQTARLAHPNTVTIYDYGRTPEGIFYYAMELLEGATLEQVVETCGPQPAARVVHIAGQIASALCEAHAMGLIHRDVKPANVILGERTGIGDVVKVVDFGLVKELENHTVSLTQAGTVSGTPLYLAPEAITSPDQIDARVDLYALGALMYYLLAGENVFRGHSTMEVCAHHLHSQPVPIRERARAPISEELAALVMDCLAKDPAQRPQTAEAVLERLQGCPETGAWVSRDARAWWAAHGTRLSAKRTRPTGSAQSTMAIDLQNRGPSSGASA
jgi:eukaryotic-like serine/threonine-protein kinase